MQRSRIDTQQLRTAVARATELVGEAIDVIAPFVTGLADAERATALNPPKDFSEAGRTLARSAEIHPDLFAACDFDPEEVITDLDNVAVLSPLFEKVERLGRVVGDARLVWLAEAWIPSLALYALATVRAKTKADLQNLVDALAEVFSTPRKRTKSIE